MFFENKYVFLDPIYREFYLFDTADTIQSKYKKHIFANSYTSLENANELSNTAFEYVGKIKYAKYIINSDWYYNTKECKLAVKSGHLMIYAYIYNEKINKKTYVLLWDYTNIGTFLTNENVIKCAGNFDHIKNNTVTNLDCKIDINLDFYFNSSTYIIFTSKEIDKGIYNNLLNLNSEYYEKVEKFKFVGNKWKNVSLNYLNDKFFDKYQEKFYKDGYALVKKEINQLINKIKSHVEII